MITVHRLSALLSVVLRVRARRLETVFVVNDPPLQPARLVDDAFEQPPDGFGAEGPFGGNATHVFEDQLLTVRLVHLDALQLFQSADFAHASCALVQKAHQHFVDAVLPKLKALPGFCGALLLRRLDGDEIEFVVQTHWESMHAIERFAGARPEVAVVEPAARAALKSFDATVRHYEVVPGG